MARRFTLKSWSIPTSVIPAKAGIHVRGRSRGRRTRHCEEHISSERDEAISSWSSSSTSRVYFRLSQAGIALRARSLRSGHAHIIASAIGPRSDEASPYKIAPEGATLSGSRVIQCEFGCEGSPNSQALTPQEGAKPAFASVFEDRSDTRILVQRSDVRAFPVPEPRRFASSAAPPLPRVRGPFLRRDPFR